MREESSETLKDGRLYSPEHSEGIGREIKLRNVIEIIKKV
jgi:hypothetical protein